jgi:hypothetical protein
MRVACRVGRIGVRDEIEEGYESLSKQPHNSVLRKPKGKAAFQPSLMKIQTSFFEACRY